jgi:hypothetical protein
MSMTRSTHSVKLREALEDLRPAFRDVGQTLESLTRKRAELAPAFMKAFVLWKRETRRTFIAFVHELDPRVPVNDRKAYQAHPSYQAALYLQQLAEDPAAKRRRGLTPLTLVAVVLKSVLPLFSEAERREVLDAVAAASQWRERDVNRLLAMVAKGRTRVVALPKVPRLVDTGKVAKAAVLAFEKKREREAAVA